jgi:DNA repair photolyase
MKVIYEPKGRAKEYAELAVNLYNGCSHGCEYCYAPAVMHRTKEDFFGRPTIRKDVIPKLVYDVEEMEEKGDNREVLMCFSCDPYQLLDVEHRLTRKAITLFERYNLNYSVLTKGGKRSELDFDIIKNGRYGVTLVFAKDEDSLKYEPGAAPTSERIGSLRIAHSMGIKTWVSIEPSWSSEDTHNLLFRTVGIVDEYKIGKLNYHAHSKEVDWKEYKNKVVETCEFYKVDYKLKNDLLIL